MVGSYREDAASMLEQDRPYSAGALLYESAKQSVNAVANQQGENPGYTRALKPNMSETLPNNAPMPPLIYLQDGERPPTCTYTQIADI